MSRSHQLTSVAAVVVVVAAAALVSGGGDVAPVVPAFDAAGPDEWDARLADVSRRTAAKSALVAELIDERRSLADVAAEFRRMSTGGATDSMVHYVYAGSTPGERYCRQVLAYAEVALAGHPNRARIQTRLVEELDHVRAAGGRLPDVSAR